MEVVNTYAFILKENGCGIHIDVLYSYFNTKKNRPYNRSVFILLLM